MFHRPKQETQNETTSSETRTPPVSGSSSSSVPSSVSVAASNADSSERSKLPTSTPLKPQTQKDTTAMTTDQDNKATDTSSSKSVDIPQTTASSPFQRPSPTPAKTYGTYNPTPYGTPATPSLGAGSGNDRRLVIGQGITMSGEIESCDHLLVEGSVEAALKGAKVLEISETGKFYGTVEIEEATISGQFEGEIYVSGRLTVASTGIITGSIAYGELQIEAGATIDGKLAPLVAKASAKKGKSKKTETELPLAS